jgi:SAM-dependent MidA family methyltransferase
MQSGEPGSVSAALADRVGRAIDAAGGWLGFERFMELALYEPGLGYYARHGRKFGLMPASGSDFATAPEMTPLFGQALARQVAQALDACGVEEVWEFGAGSGALARQLLQALGPRLRRYTIVDLSAVLRERQQAALAGFEPVVRWADALPDKLQGVVVGNEVLDAMPVVLLHWDGAHWRERGVVRAPAGGASSAAGARFAFADRDTPLRPPVEGPFAPGAVVELPRQACAFVRTLAERLHRGAAFFVDYGFPEAEYYHPQRSGGTLMCHRAHRADTDPLSDLGEKDITAHVDFTAVALAGQDAGLHVLGYTSQAHFLMNCGLLDMLDGCGVRERAAVQKLLGEHEMGELFKVVGFATQPFDAVGFARGDRSHRL